MLTPEKRRERVLTFLRGMRGQSFHAPAIAIGAHVNGTLVHEALAALVAEQQIVQSTDKDGAPVYYAAEVVIDTSEDGERRRAFTHMQLDALIRRQQARGAR